MIIIAGWIRVGSGDPDAPDPDAPDPDVPDVLSAEVRRYRISSVEDR